MRSRLTPLQTEILMRFFAEQAGFFLTGGAALAGYHLGHRETHDLDLFTAAGNLDDGERTLRDIARQLGLEIESLQRAPSFRRNLLRSVSPAEGVIVDLVRDHAPQLEEKLVMGTVTMDSAAEILVNKICALLSRIEIRDLVDVKALADSGLDPVEAVSKARRKDGGVSPGQLAWVLSTYPIEERDLPGGVEAAQLRAFRDDLVRRLAVAGFPGGGQPEPEPG